MNETAQFFYTHASNVENLEKVEKRERQKEIIEVVEDGNLKNEKKLKTAGRLKSKKLSNDDDDDEDDDDFSLTIEEHSAQVEERSSSARELRLRLSSMTKEEKDEWRTQALIPGTIPHAGKYALFPTFVFYCLLTT